MEKRESNAVNPRDIFPMVYETVGESEMHIQEFMGSSEFEWKTWCQERSRMIPLISAPLMRYWNSLSECEKLQLKKTLIYLLNSDEHVPYEASQHLPGLSAKERGLVQRMFSSFQDALVPYDGYAFCQWVWEIIFKDEDWHADVSQWVQSEVATLYVKLQSVGTAANG